MSTSKLSFTPTSIPESISGLLSGIDYYIDVITPNNLDRLCFMAREGGLIEDKVVVALGEVQAANLYEFVREWYGAFAGHAESWSNQNVKVTVALVEGLKQASSEEDRESVSIGDTYDFVSLPHDAPWEAVECIKDWFHNSYAIGNLEDFEISYEWSKL